MKLACMSNGPRSVIAVFADGKWYDTGETQMARVLLEGTRRVGQVLDSDRELTSDYYFTVPMLPHRNVMCLGKNFSEHAEEFAKFNDDAEVVPSAPIVFTKAVSALCGPYDDIRVDHDLARALDYETELAVVIGKPGWRISAAEAAKHVAGYSIINDLTARDLQSVHAQWFLGKSLPHASPIGPVVVTPDELEPRESRMLSTLVNGELRQKAQLSGMIVGVEQAIEAISRVVALEAGDIIAMGTPAGVAVSFDPPRYLRNGDVVISEIEGIGRLENRIVII